MKIAKFSLAAILSMALVGGAYAGYVQKVVVKVWQKNALQTRCNISFPADAASITSDELAPGFQTKTNATFAVAEPAVAQCVNTIYYTPEL